MGRHHLPSFNYIFVTILIITTICTIDHMARQVDGKRRHFYLKNEIWRNPPVVYRCQSGIQDSGIKELKSGQTLDYSFEDYLFLETLYFCHFYFQRKDRIFDVLTDKMEFKCILSQRPEDLYWVKCFNYHVEWVIREDGFYSRCVYFINDRCSSPPDTPSPSPLVKRHSW
ncbi:hypothetical protein RND81_11G023300 [Saponaria officinalis]|uniref:S-protein homolog n=1 Tax=Saponaria officinalis TaxID=3572 RepID=A0AAW1HHC6_SAPOF